MMEDSSRWGAIGVGQAVKVVPKVAAAMRRIKRRLAKMPPGILIPIDFGFFNIRLIQFAKGLGWKVFYFIPPGSWRRDRQGADIPKLADAIATPFPWSAEILNKMGGNAQWFGHPIKELIAERGDVERSHGSLALLPGSRAHEIALNMPIGFKVAMELGVDAEVALASSVNPAQFEEPLVASGSVHVTFTPSDTYGVVKRGRAGLICSGTATLETALCGCPFAVIYKLSPSQHLEGFLMGLKTKYVSLPNILLDREVVPEFVGRTIDQRGVTKAVERLWHEGAARRQQLADFEELSELMGPADGITQAAFWFLELAGG